MNAEYMTEVLEFVQAMNKKVTLFTELAEDFVNNDILDEAYIAIMRGILTSINVQSELDKVLRRIVKEAHERIRNDPELAGKYRCQFI